MVLLFETSSESTHDVPSSLVRAEDDLRSNVGGGGGGGGRRAERLYDADLPEGIMGRLSRISQYVSGSGGGGSYSYSGKSSKAKKENKKGGGAAAGAGGAAAAASGLGGVLGEPVSNLIMRPLPKPVQVASGGGLEARSISGSGSKWGAPPPQPQQPAAAAAAAAASKPSSTTAAAKPSPTSAAAAAKPGTASSSTAAKPPVITEDYDDIFGDGVSSDYVYRPAPSGKIAERMRTVRMQGRLPRAAVEVEVEARGRRRRWRRWRPS